MTHVVPHNHVFCTDTELLSCSRPVLVSTTEVRHKLLSCILPTSKLVYVKLQSANIEANVSVPNDKTHNPKSINTVHVTEHEMMTKRYGHDQ